MIDEAIKKARRRKSYLANKDKISKAQKEHYLRNREKILEGQKKYYEENKEKVRDTQKKYEIGHPEVIKRAKKNYKLRNKGKIKEYNKKYISEHKEQRRINKRVWRSKNKDKVKNQKLRMAYKITLDDFNMMLGKQNNCCGICGEKFIGIPCVDHDHQTKEVRGLLCRKCNSGMGGLKDDPVLLFRALEWIKRA